MWRPIRSSLDPELTVWRSANSEFRLDVLSIPNLRIRAVPFEHFSETQFLQIFFIHPRAGLSKTLLVEPVEDTPISTKLRFRRFGGSLIPNIKAMFCASKIHGSKIFFFF